MKERTKGLIMIPSGLIIGFILGFLLFILIINPIYHYFNDDVCLNELSDELLELKNNTTLPLTSDEAFFYLQSRDSILLQYILCIQ